MSAGPEESDLLSPLLQRYETAAGSWPRDTMTGLYSYGLLRFALDHLTESAPSSTTSLAFVLLDLDDFGRTNSRLGFAEGDRLLKVVGASLNRCVRDEDVPAHLCQDDFAVILPRTEARFAHVAAERMRRAVTDIPEVGLTASVGFAMYPQDAGTPEFLARTQSLVRVRRMNRNSTSMESAARQVRARCRDGGSRRLNPVKRDWSRHGARRRI